jgi:hypothetical protein
MQAINVLLVRLGSGLPQPSFMLRVLQLFAQNPLALAVDAHLILESGKRGGEGWGGLASLTVGRV